MSVTMSAWLENDRVLAFVIAERGRLLCERLPAVPRGRDLREAHRGFGMAGYLLGEDLGPFERNAIVDLCREHADASPTDDEELEGALLLALHGRVVCSRCSARGSPWPHIAFRHLLGASQALTRVIGLDRSRILQRNARDAGHTEAGWQRRNLTPEPEPLRGLA
jgi:hypothetical protein